MSRIFMAELLEGLQHPQKYLRMRSLTRQRKIDLASYVALYPYVESRKWTQTYQSAKDGDDKGVIYNSYMHAYVDMVIDLFETAHCSHFHTDPCSTICQKCMLRMEQVVNLVKFVETHMPWCLAHSPYYEDLHPVFSQFMNQIIAKASSRSPSEFS